MAVVEEGHGGRASWTDWTLVERYGDVAALVSCTLHTVPAPDPAFTCSIDRPPLLGDVAYGWKKSPSG